MKAATLLLLRRQILERKISRLCHKSIKLPTFAFPRWITPQSAVIRYLVKLVTESCHFRMDILLRNVRFLYTSSIFLCKCSCKQKHDEDLLKVMMANFYSPPSHNFPTGEKWMMIAISLFNRFSSKICAINLFLCYIVQRC